MSGASKARVAGSRQAQLLAVLAVMGAVAQSPAQTAGETTERYLLRWVREGGAESCVSGAALERLLAGVVPAQVELVSPTLLLEGRAELASEPMRFRVRISVRDAATEELIGERELTTADARCSALTPAVLLVLAMSVDPDAVSTGLPSAVAEELRRGVEEDVDVWPVQPRAESKPARIVPASPSAPASVQAAAPELPHPPSAPPPVRPTLRLALSGSHEIQPEPTLGLMLQGRVPWGRAWSTGVSVLVWQPHTVALPASPYLLDDGVDFNAAQLSLAVCRRLIGSRLYLDGCAGAQFGFRWITAHALANKDNPYRAFFGPTLGLDAAWSIGSGWSIDGGATVAAALRQDSFAYRDHEGKAHDLFAPARLSGWIYLGIGRQL